MKIRSILPLFALTVLVALPISAPAAASYEDRLKEIETAVKAKRSAGKEAFYSELETQARALLKDFPEKDDPYAMLLSVAQNGTPEKKAAILKELDNEKAPAKVRAQIKGSLAQVDALGKPLDIKFKSVDGRDVNLASLKGKVVLVDFWATWCGPCVAELPHVLEAYEKLHDKGFEIVGISFDREKSELESFIKEKKMPWPQYFPAKPEENEFGTKFGISSIPTMWLVDKKGNLADMNGRDGLQAKVEKMLAE